MTNTTTEAHETTLTDHRPLEEEVAARVAAVQRAADDATASDATASDAPDTPDLDATVLSLLLAAATDLAHAGYGDRACQLAASAWSALRVPRPELAVRVTAALHRLVRLAAAEPVTFRAAPAADSTGTGTGTGTGGGDSGGDPTLDVRQLAPAQRHQSIFTAYQALAPGAGFVLVNDHDPKPLRYQFEAEHDGEFTWDYYESGPQVWRVRIGKPATAGGTPDGTGNGTGPELDVRVLPHGRRHDVIFATYQALAPGAGFVLVNDHDPQPLRYQLEAQHGDGLTWDYVEPGPEVWRVRIGRAGPR